MACSRARALSVGTAKSCPALMRRPRGAATSVACVSENINLSASGNAANKNSSPFVPAPASPASGYCSCHAIHSEPRVSPGSERMLPGTRSDSENMMPESTQFSSWGAAFPPRPCGTTRSASPNYSSCRLNWLAGMDQAVGIAYDFGV